MTRYVVLSSDAAPTYSIFLPLVARIWSRIGYRPLVLLHDKGWYSDYGKFILDALDVTGARIDWFSQVKPLTVANTMRASRIVASALPFLKPDDLLLTADVDMVPIERAFFERDESWFVLRALYNVWCRDGGVTKMPRDAEGLRFAMCYCGATVALWRELMFLDPEVDPVANLKTIVTYQALEEPFKTRQVSERGEAVWGDLDEMTLSQRWLGSLRVGFEPCVEVKVGEWRKGDLTLVDPVDRPHLSSLDNVPRGLLRLGDLWRPHLGPPPAGAIDLIPPRFAHSTRRFHPWWIFDAVAAYYPEDREWLETYRARVQRILEAQGSSLGLWTYPGGVLSC